jgi:hypothetical protein
MAVQSTAQSHGVATLQRGLRELEEAAKEALVRLGRLACGRLAGPVCDPMPCHHPSAEVSS